MIMLGNVNWEMNDAFKTYVMDKNIKAIHIQLERLKCGWKVKSYFPVVRWGQPKNDLEAFDVYQLEQLVIYAHKELEATKPTVKLILGKIMFQVKVDIDGIAFVTE